MVLKAFTLVPGHCAIAGLMLLPLTATAQAPPEEPWNAKFQATYVW
jgi:high affinity Mn2+ porin